jgi:2,3-bisphosphoglycerate-independent phosphoglycerate mutase
VLVLLAADSFRFDEVRDFGDRHCLRGSLGQIEAKHLLSLERAHASRLGRFGA